MWHRWKSYYSRLHRGKAAIQKKECAAGHGPGHGGGSRGRRRLVVHVRRDLGGPQGVVVGQSARLALVKRQRSPCGTGLFTYLPKRQDHKISLLPCSAAPRLEFTDTNLSYSGVYSIK